MADNNNGALSFKALIDTGQINTATAETLRRFQQLSDGAVKSGGKIDEAFNITSKEVSSALSDIGRACEENERKLQSLTAEYDRLSEEAGQAFMAGRDDEYVAIKHTMSELEGEIAVRRRLQAELHENSNVIEENMARLDEHRQKAEANSQAQESLRTRLRHMRETLIEMEAAGQRNTATYRQLQEEVGQLTDAWNDAQTQAQVLAHDQRGFQGIISGLSGISGAISAATGAMTLFGSENEDLQKIMAKVQSVMAITIGLQQVEQTLNKDSAFSLVTLNALKEWWAKITAEATATQTAEVAARSADAIAATEETVAVSAETAAQTANTVAAAAGTTANWTLAASFKAVGLAIKSIPVFGWIAAGIAVLVAALADAKSKSDAFIESIEEERRKTEEWRKGIAGAAAGNVASYKSMEREYNKLRSEHEKIEWIKNNQTEFTNLGISVNTVADAENIFVKNTDKMVEAFKLRAEAAAWQTKVNEEYAKLISRRLELESSGPVKKGDKVPGSSHTTQGGFETVDASGNWVYTEAGAARAEAERQQKITNDAILQEIQGRIDGYVNKQAELTQRVNDLVGDAFKAASTSSETKTGGQSKNDKTGENDKKDPFKDMLDQRKKSYQEFYAWQNAEDEKTRQAATVQFAELTKEGSTYFEFLKNKRDALSNLTQRSAEQERQLTILNNELASESKNSQIEAFKKSLSEELAQAKTIQEMLDVIKKKREEVGGDQTQLGQEKTAVLDDAQANVTKQQTVQYNQLLSQYSSYLDKKVQLDQQYLNDLSILEAKQSEAKTQAEYQQIQNVIDERKKAYKVDVGNNAFEEFRNSSDWSDVFGNFDEMTTAKLQELKTRLNEQPATWRAQFNPEDLATIQQKIDEITATIRERNPFAALTSSVTALKNGMDKTESSKKLFSDVSKSASSTIGLIGGTFESVVSGFEKMGITLDEETQTILNDISGCLDGAQTLAQGIASSNPLQVIQGSVSFISSAFDMFNSKDRKLEKQIKAHQKNLSKLQSTYKRLEREVDKALGTDQYKTQEEEIANLYQQIDEVNAMIDAEEDKKDTDWDRIDDWNEDIQDLYDQIEDVKDSIVDDLLQTDVKTWAGELSDALVEAWQNGEDALKEFDTSFNSVMRNIIKNMLQKNVIEKQLSSVTDYLEAHLKDDFTLSDSELAEVDRLAQIAKEAIMSRTDAYEELIKRYTDSEADTSLSGAVKGIQEETASVISGTLQSIRINQINIDATLKQQLLKLDQIELNTQSCKNLVLLQQITKQLSDMTQNYQSQRSMGI